MNKHSNKIPDKILKKLTYSSLLSFNVTLMVIFSIFFNPQNSFATIENKEDIVSVTYLSGWVEDNIETGGALQFSLNQGWKTYWREPGPYGIRPIIDWSKSKNIQNIIFLWPTPKIFNQYNVKVIGYANNLIIPMKITKKIPNKRAFLNINLEFGVCSDICLLKTAKISTPLETQASDDNLDLITEALKKIPSRITKNIFSSIECAIKKKSEDLNVLYAIRLLKKPKSKPTIILEYADTYEYLENPNMQIQGKNLLVEASLKNIYENEGIIERDRLKATILLEERGFEIIGCS